MITIEKALESVPKLKEFYQTDPDVKRLLDVGQQLEGMPRHASTHAAGVVIAPAPITEFAPLYQGKDGERTTGYSMGDVESIGLLKMDFLGLKTLTLIDDAVALSGHENVQARYPSSDEPMQVGRSCLARAVGSLIDNAVKFSSQDAPVEIELKYEQDGVVIVVSDRGCGVDELERTRIFAPFEQGNKALTDKPGGMGMGLYEAESIAKRHGGTLEYEPRQEGGSRFVLTLPGTRIDSAELEKEAAHA